MTLHDHAALPGVTGEPRTPVVGIEDALLASISDNTLAESAAIYARRNIAVFPVVSQGKRPLTENGFHAATTDPQVVESYWRRWPGANIGASIPPGLIVIDIDVRHGGDETLFSLDASDRRLPLTLSALTGGGAHLWYEGEDERVRQGSNVLGPGIDTRLPGRGYVIVPPSVHHTGVTYRWENTSSPAPLPAWAIDAMQLSVGGRRLGGASRPGRKASTGSSRALDAARLRGLARKVSRAEVGERNSILNWAGFTARELDVRPHVVIAVLTVAAMGTGLDEHETEQTIRSSYGTA